MKITRVDFFAGEQHFMDDGDWCAFDEVEPFIEIVKELADYPTKGQLEALVEKVQELLNKKEQ